MSAAKRKLKSKSSPFPFRFLETAKKSSVFEYLKQLFLRTILYIPAHILPVSKIQVFESDDVFYVADQRDIDTLWMNGGYGRKKETKDGLRLLLTIDEIIYLNLLHAIVVISNSTSIIVPLNVLWSRVDQKKFVAFWFYKSKGYCVKPGVLYGCDYLLYRVSPSFYHSDFGVKVLGCESSTVGDTWIDLQASVRSLAKVKKSAPITPFTGVVEQSNLVPRARSCDNERALFPTVRTTKLPQSTTRTLQSQRSSLKSYSSPISKTVKFKSSEFEELCYFTRETPPSHIPLSPMFTTEDDLWDLSAAEICCGASRTILHLINFISATAFSISQKLSRIASVRLDLTSIVGIVDVQNIAFNKEVTVRFTLDNWKTYRDITATYVSSGQESLLGGQAVECGIDQFEFKIDAQTIIMAFEAEEKSDSTSLIKPASISFAVCYKVNGESHWDSNNNSNYTIELRRTFVKSKRMPIVIPAKVNTNFIKHDEKVFLSPELEESKTAPSIIPPVRTSSLPPSSPIAGNQGTPITLITTLTPTSKAYQSTLPTMTKTHTLSPNQHLINLSPFKSNYQTVEVNSPFQKKQGVICFQRCPSVVVPCQKPNSKSLITAWSGSSSSTTQTITHPPILYPHSFSNSNINNYGTTSSYTLQHATPGYYATEVCGFSRAATEAGMRIEDNGMNDASLGYVQIRSLYANADYLSY